MICQSPLIREAREVLHELLPMLAIRLGTFRPSSGLPVYVLGNPKPNLSSMGMSAVHLPKLPVSNPAKRGLHICDGLEVASGPRMPKSNGPNGLLHNRPVPLDHVGKSVQRSTTARPFGFFYVQNDFLNGPFPADGLHGSHISTSHFICLLDTTDLVSYHPVASQTVKAFVVHCQGAISFVYIVLQQVSARVNSEYVVTRKERNTDQSVA